MLIELVVEANEKANDVDIEKGQVSCNSYFCFDFTEFLSGGLSDYYL